MVQKALIYYLTLPLLYAISLLPRFILYRVSDILAFLLIYVLPYRKKVIRDNLSQCFPEWTQEQVTKAQNGFYRHLCDLIVETLKTLTISKRATERYMLIEDRETFNKMASSPNRVMILMAHYGSWELAAAHFAAYGPAPLMAAYRPLSNPYFDRLFYRLRSRLGSDLVPAHQVFRRLLEQENHKKWIVFIADQSADPRTGRWIEFLGRETLIFGGPERIARKLAMPVLYGSTKRIRRGKYTIHAEVLTDNAAAMEEGEVMRSFFEALERDIRNSPETWLWSHRRWKHKQPQAT